MATETPVVPQMAWPREAVQVATQYNCEQHIAKVWQMTRRVFPANRIEVLVEGDPEIADLQFVVFDVTVNGWDAPKMIEARERWTQGLYECCPQTNPFVLGFRPGD
jgi:hypothetical protein